MCVLLSRMQVSVTRSGRPPPWRRSAFGFGGVVRHGRADKGLERLLIDLVAFVEIDGAPHIAVEAGVEEARRVCKRGAIREGELHLVLVGLAGAEDAVVLPHRHAQRVRRLRPFQGFDHFGIGFVDEGAEPLQHLRPPIPQLCDLRIDQLRRRLTLLHSAHALSLLKVLYHGRKSVTAPMISSAKIKITINNSSRAERAVSIRSANVSAALPTTPTLPLSKVPRSMISYSSSRRA